MVFEDHIFQKISFSWKTSRITGMKKISQMKEDALRDIKNASVRISIEAVESLIKNSIDKSKLEKFYLNSLEQTKIALKNTKN